MKLSDKFLPFFSVTPSKKFFRLFERAKIKNVLISYHYIRQDPVYSVELMKRVQDWGGVFMVDSGIFSFAMDKEFDAEKFKWQEYCEEYVNFLKDNKQYIGQACNLDADSFIGHENIKDYNRAYFEPLEKDINIFYVAHKSNEALGDLGIFKEYCKKYRCVAVNESMSKYASDIYQIAKQNNTAIHGLAWTKPTLLKDCPMFSVDSSSWVNYQKYGATIFFDGVNFQQYDKDNKSIRKTLKKYCDKYGVGFKEFCDEKNPDGSHNDDEGLTFSLCAWRETLEYVGRIASHKLKQTVGDVMDGKAVILKPEPSTNKGGLGAYLETKVANGEFEDAKPVVLSEYEQREDGSQVVVVNAREDVESITEYNTKLSGALFCNNCFIKDKCPKFLINSACGFNFSPAEFTKDPLAIMDNLITAQSERVNRAMLFEKMEGGLPNKVYSQELSLLARLNEMKASMMITAQQRGFKFTERTIEVMGGGDAPAPKGGGFMEILMQELKKG